MYDWLAIQMGLDRNKTHVSMFNREQCKQAIKILRPKYIQIHGHDLPYERKEKIMKLQVTKQHIFETAHLLPKRGGKYDGLYSRTYTLKVTIEGPQTGDYDMIIPFEELDEALSAIVPDHKFICYKEDEISSKIEEILKEYNVSYLELPYIVNSENLIKYLKEQLDNYIHNILNYKDLKIVEMELFSVNNTCSVKAIY